MTARVTKEYKNNINCNVYKIGDEIEINNDFDLVEGFYLIYALNEEGVETVDWIDKNYVEIIKE
ncbi:hypothetical protein [Clostridium perfringens]|uniref:hypothetical protein n=1 Tax=Clostridium perfringens TaxID=1502 RepID=UPI001896CCE5|nr:hypothetical protein [Clostridium perfringens]